MLIGMIGLGRMGANKVRRMIEDGHECVIHDRDAQSVSKLQEQSAASASSIEAMISQLAAPRTLWLMLPVADKVLSAMRHGFGVRLEKTDPKQGG